MNGKFPELELVLFFYFRFRIEWQTKAGVGGSFAVWPRMGERIRDDLALAMVAILGSLRIEGLNGHGTCLCIK
jgi:hypothetical protein